MIRAFVRDRTGATAAEFALVLPLLLIFLLGIVDVGRWLWVYNEAQKATQMGARLAVVGNPVSDSINADYIGRCFPPLTQGDKIPVDCFPTVTCTSAGCDNGTKDNAAFNEIVARMRAFLPTLTAENVTVKYSPSGLGYAGNPFGADISPLVTVEIGKPNALQFVPVTFLLLSSMDMPEFTTTLTAEDLRGADSN